MSNTLRRAISTAIDESIAAVVERLIEKCPEVTAPTLAEVTAFSEQVLISTVYGTGAGIGEFGLQVVVD